MHSLKSACYKEFVKLAAGVGMVSQICISNQLVVLYCLLDRELAFKVTNPLVGIYEK